MSPTASIVLGLALVSVVLVLMSMGRNSVLRRVSMRNVRRRKGTTLLVVTGSLVGTAMIAGSLVIGDTFQRAGHDLAYSHMGEIDEVVYLPGSAGQRQYFSRALTMERANVQSLNAFTRQSQGADLVDGALGAIHELVPARKVGASGEAVLFEPQVSFLALDFGELATFGSEPPNLSIPAPGQVLASRSLARELELERGNSIEVLVNGRPYLFVVKEVVPDAGVSGYRRDDGITFGIGGTLQGRLEDGQRVFGKGPDDINVLFISNRGGVLGSDQHTEPVREALGTALSGAAPTGEFLVAPLKRGAGGVTWMSSLFGLMSSFAILAGIMLMINIYTMLAEERRSEMGTLRAIGANPGHVARLYLYEGLIYTIGAGVAGVGVGLLLVTAVVWGLNQVTVLAIFLGSDLVPTFKPASLVMAAALGALITLGTVLFTSVRNSRVEIVAALRDLPDPQEARRRSRTVIWPLVPLLLGLLMTAGAVAQQSGYLYLLGPAVVLLGIGLLLSRTFSSRPVFSLVFLVLAVYSQLSYQIPVVEEAIGDDSPFFFVTGAALVFSGIGLLALNLPVVVWAIRQTLGRLPGVLPVVRLAVSHAAERPLRTGFTLGMFALIVYVITVTSIYIGILRPQLAERLETEAGGFDAILRVSPHNPVTDLAGRLRQSEDVGPSRVISISAVRVAQAELSEYRQGDYYDPGTAGAGNPQAPLTEQVTGLDETFLLSTRSSLAVRAPEYSIDADAWAALAKDSSLVILSGRYAARSRHPWPNLGAGDILRLRNPVTGVVYEKRVIGRMADSDIGQVLLPGVMMRAQEMEQEFSNGTSSPVSSYLLRFAPSVDQKALANSIEKELIAQGAQVFLVREWVERLEGFLQSFLRIAEGFLAFGLVVGVAGLAVVATRAVFQRRREIGTLRALGFQRGMVLGYFLVEVSFISALGILLGIAAGTLSGYGVYLQQLKDEGLAFVWPVLELALIAALIWVASLIFTFLPARHAASLEPVEALRAVE